MEQTNVLAATRVAQGVETRASAELEDFELLVRNEQQRVYRVLWAMLHDEEAAETLTQDCFVKVFENRHKFRGECSLRTWVLRIAMNLARDYSRNRRSQFWRRLFQWNPEPEEIGAIADRAASPERTLAAREELATVWSDMESLSVQQRAVFTLRFVEDMSIERIAEATSLRPGTVPLIARRRGDSAESHGATTSMTAHFNDEQLAQWMLGDHDSDAAHHLAQCDACRASIDDMETRISNYRDAVLSYSGRGQIFWTRQALAIHERVRTRRFTPALRWAYAATAVLVLCAAFLVTRMPRPHQQVVTNDSADDVLLQQVENDVAREYPIALAPAALIAEERDGALAGDDTSSLNNATHKEQDR